MANRNDITAFIPPNTDEQPVAFTRAHGIIVRPIQGAPAKMGNPDILVAALCQPHALWQKYLLFPRS